MVSRRRVLSAALVVVITCVMLFAFASQAFAFENNDECYCHQSSTSDWTVGDVSAPGGVNRSTACVKCHTAGLYGTHPKHYGGGNCGSICHMGSGWGGSDPMMVPGWVGAEGSFASAASKDTSAAALHTIHSQTKWMSTATSITEKCASCHGIADCSACHESAAVTGYHELHSSTGDTSWTARSSWNGVTSHGVIGGDLTMETDWAVSNQCAISECHNVAGMVGGKAVQHESHSHAPTPLSPFTDVVTYAPAAWTRVTGAQYTLGETRFTNKLNYTLSSTFPSQIIEVVASVDPYYGLAEIYIDGALKGTIDCYASTTGHQKVVFRSDTLSVGDHTIMVKALGTKNPLSRGTYVFIDGFRVYPTVASSARPKCSGCHAAIPAQITAGTHGYTYSHVMTATAFTTGTYATIAGTFTCPQCHAADMPLEHRRPSSKTNGGVCEGCHPTYAPKVVPSTVVSCSSNNLGATRGCHQSMYNQQAHNGLDTTHTVDTSNPSEAKCRKCHAGNLDVVHDESIATNDTVTNCLTCHSPTASPTKGCLSGCHTVFPGGESFENHPYTQADHYGNASLDTTVANTGGLSCGTCHVANLNIVAEHDLSTSTKADSSAIICSTCHDLAYQPTNWSGQCAVCHSGGTKAPVAHSAVGFETKHDFSANAANVTACGGIGCHDVTQVDLLHDASLPGNGACISCHQHSGAPTVPTERLCTDSGCHTPHNLATPHQAPAGASGCIKCHTTFTNINTAHPSCATCHANPLLTDYLKNNYTANCTDCHSTGAGKLNKKTYTPSDPNHYNGTETTHTAGAAQASSTYDYDGSGTAYVGRRCDACHSMEMKPEHITKTYSNFVGIGTTYADKCEACHIQKVAGFSTAWNKTCAPCHASQHTGVSTAHNAAATILTSKVGSPTAGSACGTAGCHDVANIQAIHNNSVTSNDSSAACVTTCINTCHNANPVPAKKACDAVGCHFGMADHNADHAPAANLQCAACHESADVKTVHGGAGACAVCHANPVYPGITTTNTASCGTGSCHNATEIGRKSYALPNAHYAGEEASHTSAGNGTYNGYNCVTCHILDLKDEHAKTTVAYVTGSYAGTSTVIGKCVGCHELKVDSFSVAWDKKCASCHAATHTDRTTKHNASASNAGCGPSKAAGCHDVNDVAAIHNESIPANSMHPSCLTCHTSNTAIPAPIDCDASGCHFGQTHSHSMNLTGSNYVNGPTPMTVSGCTNSGIGCHGSTATSPTPDYAITQFHPAAASGCQSTGRCHRNASNTSTNTSQADPAFNNPNTCQNCHGGRTVAPLLYDGAPKVTKLTSATPNGHYNEATHTIVSNLATMSVGGYSFTTCITCHQSQNPVAGGLNGEWYQHQSLAAPMGDTTCQDCHSFVTPGDVEGTSRVGDLIKDAVAANQHLECKDCHSVLIMGVGYDIHETTSSPPATATVMSTSNFQCGDTECHASTGLEIHVLHKGDGKIIPYQRWTGSSYTTYTVDRCSDGTGGLGCHHFVNVMPYTVSALATTTQCERRPEPKCTDCHDKLAQGRKPTATTCGVNGACHKTSPHTQMGSAHNATAESAKCVECHETYDLRENHGYSTDDTCGSTGTNNMCHNLEGVQFKSGETTITFHLAGKKECADCHTLGAMPNVKRNHAPHDPNHYVGSETTHTAINQTGSFGKIYSVIATESFTGGATWPTAWTRSNTTTVTSSASAPTYGQILNSAAVARYAYFQRTVDTANISSPTVSFKYTTGTFAGGDDNANVEISTNGTTFNTIWTTTAAQSAWTTIGPIAVSRATTLTIRFSATTNSSAYFRVDDIVVKPGDAVGAGCFDTCHYDELKPEHTKPSAISQAVLDGTYTDFCIDCHETKVDAFDTDKRTIQWSRTCTQCHADTNHAGQTVKHDATLIPDATQRATVAQCGASGCHYIKDVAVIHNNSSLGNTWPANPAQSCTVCHQSKTTAPVPPTGWESYSALYCGLPGCHEGVSAHAHTLDYDGSMFNAGATPADMSGCIQSGAGCHGNLTGTNYAADYHPQLGCLNGKCHDASATNHNDPQFNDPNTCMNCHGGGAQLYAGATDRIPIAGATPNGHYNEATHTAVSSTNNETLTVGGTISAKCIDCHKAIDAAGVDGLYFQHQGLTTGSKANVTCVDCHNYSLPMSTLITGGWTTRRCLDCHNTTMMPTYSSHTTNTSTFPKVMGSVMGTVAAGNTCLGTGCHANADLHALHKGSASTPATRTALGCAFDGCHDYTKQGAKPTKKSCGTNGDCHKTDAHNPTAHAIGTDTGTCTRCHEAAGNVAATDVRDVYKSTAFGNVKAHTACSTCHNGTLVLPASTDCVGCHNGTKVGTHVYSPYATGSNHYYTASHDSSVTNSRTWGTTNYGKTLTDYHGTSLNYNNSCTLCHTIDLATEHNKTSVSFNLGGKADKCVACHEGNGTVPGVDNWSARWAGSCSGESNSCHDDTTLHDELATKHNASAAVMTTPGISFVAGSMITSTQEFTGATLPDGWTTTSSANVKITTTDTAGLGNSVLWVMNGTAYGFNMVKTYSTLGYTSAKITFKYKINRSSTSDYLALQYSTNGTAWTELVRYNAANVTAWTQSATYDLPISGTLRVRFIGYQNAAAEYAKVDDVNVTLSSPSSLGAQLAAGSTAAQSCMNNPNGTNCHDVTDVANIHSRTANSGCPLCHTSTAQHPADANCQNTGCHVGINLNSHNADWHESTFGSTSSGVFSGSGIAVAWCRGCHDDSIDNEHFVLSAYAASPCSMCHKKSADSGAPTNVTSANTSATIHADTTADNELCEDCHKTMGPSSATASGTAFGFHVQEAGLTTPGATSLATTAGVQWSPNWSGHRSMSAMPGAKEYFGGAADGGFAVIRWTLVTATSYLKSGWSNNSMVVCSDCHGDISGATGPHGGTMSLGIASGYINDFSTGALYNNGGNLSNTTTSLCSKCHQTNLKYNSAHNDSNHQGSSATKGACTACHIKIPHGWKRPRLIGYTTDPLPYRTTGFTGIQRSARTPTGWSGSSQCAGCGEHTGTMNPVWP